MNKTEVMRKLKAMGTAQNRKVYARHGFVDQVYGVSYANLGKLKRQIKTDHALAEGLWASGVHDARVLATMVADPAKATAKTLDAWAKDCTDRGTAGALSNLAALAPSAWTRVEKWTRSRNEWVSTAGWHTLASLARDDQETDDAVFAEYLDRIESGLPGAPNYTRYSMNNALIAIGIRNPKLRKKAVAAARRIGKVEVDHGETSCKTPDAIPYIEKAVARQKQRKVAAAARG